MLATRQPCTSPARTCTAQRLRCPCRGQSQAGPWASGKREPDMMSNSGCCCCCWCDSEDTLFGAGLPGAVAAVACCRRCCCCLSGRRGEPEERNQATVPTAATMAPQARCKEFLSPEHARGLAWSRLSPHRISKVIEIEISAANQLLGRRNKLCEWPCSFKASGHAQSGL